MKPNEYMTNDTYALNYRKRWTLEGEALVARRFSTTNGRSTTYHPEKFQVKTLRPLKGAPNAVIAGDRFRNCYLRLRDKYDNVAGSENNLRQFRATAVIQSGSQTEVQATLKWYHYKTTVNRDTSEDDIQIYFGYVSSHWAKRKIFIGDTNL